MAPELRDALMVLGWGLVVLLIGLAVAWAMVFVVIDVLDHILEQVGDALAWLIRTLQLGW